MSQIASALGNLTWQRSLNYSRPLHNWWRRRHSASAPSYWPQACFQADPAPKYCQPSETTSKTINFELRHQSWPFWKYIQYYCSARKHRHFSYFPCFSSGFIADLTLYNANLGYTIWTADIWDSNAIACSSFSAGPRSSEIIGPA